MMLSIIGFMLYFLLVVPIICVVDISNISPSSFIHRIPANYLLYLLSLYCFVIFNPGKCITLTVSLILFHIHKFVDK